MLRRYLQWQFIIITKELNMNNYAMAPFNPQQQQMVVAARMKCPPPLLSTHPPPPLPPLHHQQDKKEEEEEEEVLPHLHTPMLIVWLQKSTH
jgi:hypothetical protein